MICPNCDTELKMSERQGVEIDYCPQCRGVWLDRGELDKIVERSMSPSGSPRYDKKQSTDDYRDNDDDKHYKKKKRGSFFEDLFDF